MAHLYIYIEYVLLKVFFPFLVPVADLCRNVLTKKSTLQTPSEHLHAN